jgi:alpha-pyrone synthase
MTSSYISSIGVALPQHRISQQETGEFMIRHLGLDEESKKMLAVLYRASGIQQRFSVIGDFANDPQNFTFFPKNETLEPFPTIGQRMKLYEQEAIKLSVKAVKNGLSENDLEQVTHLITVSCTGMYAPGLDIDLVTELGLKTDIQRTAINFMGCYAAFNALKVADSIVGKDPKANVLIVATELCSIHVVKSNNPDSLLSNALFGDGAAAVLVQGKRPERLQLGLAGFYADMEPAGNADMAWRIGDHAFEMKLSAEVPETIRKGIGTLTSKLLSKLALDLAAIDHFAIHPGGKRILEVIEEELGMTKSQNEHAYNIMRECGNMSSPTVLFVLQKIMQSLEAKNDGDNILSFAFGPGLTMESMLLKVSHP